MSQRRGGENPTSSHCGGAKNIGHIFENPFSLDAHLYPSSIVRDTAY